MTSATNQTDPSSASELELCPFCGGEAERITIGPYEPDNEGGDVINCSRCGASSHVEFGRKENLVSHWNTRTKEQPIADDEVVTIISRIFPIDEITFSRARAMMLCRAALSAMNRVGMQRESGK